MGNIRESNFRKQYKVDLPNLQPNSQNRVNPNVRNNIEPNNQNRINPNVRNNNTRPKYKRTLKNSVKIFARQYKRYINKRTLTIAALVAAAGLTTGVIINNNTNKNIDNIHAAYQYTDNVLSPDERAVKIEGYQDYIDKIAAFDRTFEESNKDTFHDFVKDLGLEDKVLDSEQITNLALEVFKVAFGEKYGVDPTTVKIRNDEPDIVIPRKRF